MRRSCLLASGGVSLSPSGALRRRLPLTLLLHSESADFFFACLCCACESLTVSQRDVFCASPLLPSVLRRPYKQPHTRCACVPYRKLQMLASMSVHFTIYPSFSNMYSSYKYPYVYIYFMPSAMAMHVNVLEFRWSVGGDHPPPPHDTRARGHTHTRGAAAAAAAASPPRERRQRQERDRRPRIRD